MNIVKRRFHLNIVGTAFLSLVLLSGCAEMLDYKNMNANLAVGAVKDIGNAAMMSDEEVQKMSIGFAKEADSKHRVAPPNSTYAKRLKKLTSKHLNEDGLNLNYKVYLSKTVNAFAMADGTIRVYSGLLDLMNDDEVLFIIGHEIGHVKHGHSANRMRVASASSGIRKGVASSSSVAGDLAASGVVGGVLEKIINSQFTQSQETESDEYGVKFMKRHGYNLDGAIQGFNKLAALSGKKSFIDGIMSSHPTSEKRAEHLAKIIGNDSTIKIASAEVIKKSKSENSEVNSAPQSNQHASLDSHVEYDIGKHTPNALENTDTSVSSQRTYGSGWYVQVLASTNKVGARAIEKKFRNKGFNAGGEEAVVRGASYQRVLIGPFLSKSKAKESIPEIRDTHLTGENPFLRYIKGASVKNSENTSLAKNF